MRRKLFNAGTVLSLLLCGGMCALWVRSYSVSDGIERGRGLEYECVQVSRGVLFAGMGRRESYEGAYDYGPSYLPAHPFERVDFDGVLRSTDGGDRDASWKWGPFSHRTKRDAAKWWYGWWEAPIAPLAAATALLPAMWVRRAWSNRRSVRRRRDGLCVKCGYDLRATPEKCGGLLDRCPECGAAVPAYRSPHNPPPERTAAAV